MKTTACFYACSGLLGAPCKALRYFIIRTASRLLAQISGGPELQARTVGWNSNLPLLLKNSKTIEA